MKKRISNNFGTTLVESLIAGILLSVVIMAVTVIFSGGALFNRKQLLQRRAVQELERTLEDIQISYYQYQELYNASVDGSIVWPDDKPNLFTFNPNPVLDDRNTTPIKGNLTVKLEHKTYVFGGENIPAVNVLAKITWDYDNDGIFDSDSLATLITVVAVH